jgi:hypothetical protein
MTAWLRLVALGLAATLAAGVTNALAATVETQGATTCQVDAFSTDRDPKGTNVRAAPRADAAVIAHLPAPVYLSGDLVGTQLDVIGAKDGWLLIRDANFRDPNGKRPDFTFAGPGWIWGGLVGAQIADGRLRTAPRDDAPILVWLMDEKRGWGADSFEVKRIHGCDGGFVELTVAPPKGTKTRRGWVSHVCASQLTTCDYPYPDGVHLPQDYQYPD